MNHSRRSLVSVPALTGFYLAISLLLWIPGAAFAQASGGCGSLENAYGPFDYSNAELRRTKLRVVEEYHLTRDVLMLKRGVNGVRPGGDLDYTLRAFPNHHQALHAAARYQLTPAGRQDMRYSIECYFERAIRFQPRDPVVRMIYGIYLVKAGRPEAARKKYEEALAIDPDSSEANYNMGLLLVQLGDYEGAEKYADIAYGKGFPLPGLRNKIRKHQASSAKSDNSGN